jgi:hypothetical protein
VLVTSRSFFTSLVKERSAARFLLTLTFAPNFDRPAICSLMVKLVAGVTRRYSAQLTRPPDKEKPVQSRYSIRMLLRTLACLALAASLTPAQQIPLGQQPPAPPLQPPGAMPPTAEVVPEDAPLTFKSKVNLVMVPVVVRNSKTGKPVNNLEKQDFVLSTKASRR